MTSRRYPTLKRNGNEKEEDTDETKKSKTSPSTSTEVSVAQPQSSTSGFADALNSKTAPYLENFLPGNTVFGQAEGPKLGTPQDEAAKSGEEQGTDQSEKGQNSNNISARHASVEGSALAPRLFSTSWDVAPVLSNAKSFTDATLGDVIESSESTSFSSKFSDLSETDKQDIRDVVGKLLKSVENSFLLKSAPRPVFTLRDAIKDFGPPSETDDQVVKAIVEELVTTVEGSSDNQENCTIAPYSTSPTTDVQTENPAILKLLAAMEELKISLPNSTQGMKENDLKALAIFSSTMKNCAHQIDVLTAQVPKKGTREYSVISDFRSYRTGIYLQALQEKEAFIGYKNFCKQLNREAINYDEFQFLFWLFYNGEKDIEVDISQRRRNCPELLDIPEDAARMIFEKLDFFNQLKMRAVCRGLREFISTEVRHVVDHYTVDMSLNVTKLIFDGRTVEFTKGNHVLAALTSVSDMLNMEKTVFKKLEFKNSATQPPIWNHLIPSSDEMQRKGFLFQAETLEFSNLDIFSLIVGLRLSINKHMENLKFAFFGQHLRGYSFIQGHIRDVMIGPHWKNVKTFECNATMDYDTWQGIEKSSLRVFKIVYNPNNDQLISMHSALLQSEHFEEGEITIEGQLLHNILSLGKHFGTEPPLGRVISYEGLVQYPNSTDALSMIVTNEKILFARLRKWTGKHAHFTSLVFPN